MHDLQHCHHISYRFQTIVMGGTRQSSRESQGLVQPQDSPTLLLQCPPRLEQQPRRALKRMCVSTLIDRQGAFGDKDSVLFTYVLLQHECHDSICHTMPNSWTERHLIARTLCNLCAETCRVLEPIVCKLSCCRRSSKVDPPYPHNQQTPCNRLLRIGPITDSSQKSSISFVII